MNMNMVLEILFFLNIYLTSKSKLNLRQTIIKTHDVTKIWNFQNLEWTVKWA